ncbi:MAG TPA: hypothetical protein VNH63_10695 [Gemmatimonadales bacterium]|nr:hypothetical protein [Gemmatimonadales bacterium]
MTREASVFLDLGVASPGSRGRLRQITAGFNSSGLAFGYQRDLFGGGVTGTTYRFGLAGGSGGLTAGFATAVYRGGTHAMGWDLGLTYLMRPEITLGAVFANIGQPVVRGFPQPFTFEPGVTWRLGAHAAISAHGRLAAGGQGGYAAGVRWGGPTHAPWGWLARVDTDRHLRRAGFAFGISIGARDAVGIVATTPGDLSGVNEADLYGLTTRAPHRR